METRITIKIKLNGEKKEITRFQFKEYTIDSKGDVLNETEYNEDGSIACKRIYRYFDDSSVKEYVEYNPFDELIERHTYVENEVGDIEKVIFEYGDTHKVIKEFHFPELGLADTATAYNENGEILGREIYVLNEDGKIVEQVETDADNTVLVKYLRTYNETGDSKEERKFIEDTLTEVTSYSYDKNGNIIRKAVKNIVDGYEVIDEYEYDERGNMTYNTSLQNGVPIFENKCTYDENGNLLTEEFFEIDYWERRVTRHEKLLHTTKST